eukprot:3056129-Ditylum_brightwellii.AAC.1
MANDVLSLLRSCNAWIDPNLVQLLGSGDAGGGDDDGGNSSKKRRRGKRKSQQLGEGANDQGDKDGTSATIDKITKEPSSHDFDDDYDEWNNPQFASLTGSRIVLKRASH